MEKETRNTLIVVAVVAILLIGGWTALSSASGVSPPFTVVESHSMQHCQSDDRHSSLGTIDTGDLILVKNKDRCTITSYVEGLKSGYQSFGDYGDVIVYYRTAANPVIHRAILWLDYNSSTNTWSAPSLDGTSIKWECTGSLDYTKLSGSLTLYGVGNVVSNGKDVTVNLNDLEKTSGYLTMGDSVSNTTFDQNWESISKNKLVSMEMIKSVAWVEIPCFGTLKLISNGQLSNPNSELNQWASNSIPAVAIAIITIIVIIFSIGYIIDDARVLISRKND